MGKGCKVVVCGLLSVGKTAILEQLLYGNHTIGKILFLSLSVGSGNCQGSFAGHTNLKVGDSTQKRNPEGPKGSFIEVN